MGNKKVTIQEAIKANEHSRVRRVGTDKWKDVKFYYPDKGARDHIMPISHLDIVGEWEIEQKPLEIWCNVYEAEPLTKFDFFETKYEADKWEVKGRIRCVKMREVTDE